jgi:hypothetical protein
MFHDIREKIVSEARLSPSLLADLAGLENYIAESYNGRSLNELVQNADDAGSRSVAVINRQGCLIVANDGNFFTEENFESLCRAASSKKVKGNHIGYRGIGFKSVINFSNKVFVISGPLQACFSRELTRKTIPEAQSVPLIRIPHEISNQDIIELEKKIQELRSAGYKTFFIFEEIDGNAIANEIDDFDATSLLFLRNVEKNTIISNTRREIIIYRKQIDQMFSSVRLLSNNADHNWLIASDNDISIATYLKNNEVSALDERDALLHAFLPTQEVTGLSVKINCDISTDPSRTRVVFDEQSNNIIKNIGAFILNILYESILSNLPIDCTAITKVLLPKTDPRSIVFQKKSFRTELLREIQIQGKIRLNEFKSRPSWMNSIDYSSFCQSLGVKSISINICNLDGIDSFLKFLEIQELTLEDIRQLLSKSQIITLMGVVEILSRIIQGWTTKTSDSSKFSSKWALWLIDNVLYSLDDIERLKQPLCINFVSLLNEKAIGTETLRMFLAFHKSHDIANILIPENQNNKVEIHDQSIQSFITVEKPVTLKKWRGAEHQVIQLMQSQGWVATDHSRENIGYDISCINIHKKQIYLEVKSIEHSNQPFIITSNEEAVARQHGKDYFVVLVLQNLDTIHFNFIQDPVNNLLMTRQCRQWVWECTNYKYEPVIVNSE